MLLSMSVPQHTLLAATSSQIVLCENVNIQTIHKAALVGTLIIHMEVQNVILTLRYTYKKWTAYEVVILTKLRYRWCANTTDLISY